MDREQACRVLNLMAEEVSLLTAAAHGADDADFWSSTCSIMESYSELSAVLPGLQCDGMFEQIGKLYIDSKHTMDGRHVNQIARVYATKPYIKLESAKQVIMVMCRNLRKTGIYSRLGGNSVAEVAESLSLGTEKEVSRIQAMMEWLLETNEPISNEVCSTTA